MVPPPPFELARILSLIAHELRTPAGVVSASVRMVLDGRGGPLSDWQRRVLDRAESAGDRVVSLLQDVSELAHLESGDVSVVRQRVALPDALRDAAARFVAPPESGIILLVNAAPSVTMLVDRERVVRALVACVHAVARDVGVGGTVSLAATALDGEALVTASGSRAAPLSTQDRVRREPLSVWGSGLGLELPLACRTIGAEHGRVHFAGDLGAPEISVWLPLAP